MVRIYHYRAKCIGCNACVEVDNTLWRMSKKDGKCTLIKGKVKKGIYRREVDSSQLQAAFQSVQNCPVGIIKTDELK